MEKEQLKKIILDDLQTDYTWLGFVIGLAEDILAKPNKVKTKLLVIETLTELLTERIIQAGMIEQEGGFCAWDASVSKIMEKIEREWSELGRDPDINEVVWFSLPRNVTSTVPLVFS